MQGILSDSHLPLVPNYLRSPDGFYFCFARADADNSVFMWERVWSVCWWFLGLKMSRSPSPSSTCVLLPERLCALSFSLR